MIQVATGGAAAVSLLLYGSFENVKEKGFCSEHKEEVAPPAGGAEECGDT